MRTAKNNVIYLLKFIAAVFVMLIHTSIFSNENTLLWQFDAFLRLAIPFFAVCTGYFLAIKGTSNNYLSNVKPIVKQLFKLVRIYILWTVIYLFVLIPKWIETGWFSLMAFVDWGISIFTSGSYFHLWYLLYLIYALLIIMVLFRFLPIKKYPIFITILYAIEVMQYGYRKFLPESLSLIARIFDILPCLSSATRILPFVMLGIYISKQKEESIYKLITKFGVSFILLVIERNFLLNSGQISVSYIMFTLPTSYYAALIAFKSRKLSYVDMDLSVLGKMSTYMYLVHPLVNEIIAIIDINSELIKFMISAGVSIISAYLLVFAKNKFNRRIRDCE